MEIGMENRNGTGNGNGFATKKDVENGHNACTSRASGERASFPKHCCAVYSTPIARPLLLSVLLSVPLHSMAA